MSEIIFKITQAGRTAATNADGSGIAIKINKIGFGTGAYTPTGNETALQAQQDLIDLGSSSKNGAQINLKVTLDNNKNYTINEIGIFLDDGTLFAIYSHVSNSVGVKTAGVEFQFVYALTLQDVNVDKIELVVQDFPQSAFQAHIDDKSSNPHNVTAAQLDVYSKNEVNDLVENVIKTYLNETAYAVGDYVESVNILYKVTTAVPASNTTAPTSNSSFTKLNNIQLLDEDDMSSNSDTKAPTQQSVKTYIDNKSIKIYANETAYLVNEYVDSANILYKVTTAVPNTNTTAPATNNSFTQLNVTISDVLFFNETGVGSVATYSLDNGKSWENGKYNFFILSTVENGIRNHSKIIDDDNLTLSLNQTIGCEFNTHQQHAMSFKKINNTSFRITHNSDAAFKITKIKGVKL